MCLGLGDRVINKIDSSVNLSALASWRDYMKKLLASAIYSYIYLYMYLISSKCSKYFTVKCMEIERNVMRSLHLINFLRSTYVFE